MKVRFDVIPNYLKDTAKNHIEDKSVKRREFIEIYKKQAEDLSKNSDIQFAKAWIGVATGIGTSAVCVGVVGVTINVIAISVLLGLLIAGAGTTASFAYFGIMLNRGSRIDSRLKKNLHQELSHQFFEDLRQVQIEGGGSGVPSFTSAEG